MDSDMFEKNMLRFRARHAIWEVLVQMVVIPVFKYTHRLPN